MDKNMYNLIKEHYTELYNNYCRNKDLLKIKNSNTAEDIFNEKILSFMLIDLERPTIELLKLYLKTKRTERQRIFTDEYKEHHGICENDEIVIIDTLKYLFIDYRPEKKLKKK